MANTILKMQGISKQYGGIRALSDVSMELREGEILCLLGENGAGKSTLMKILSGVVAPSAGEIFLNDQKIDIKNPEVAHGYGISTVYQELVQFPDMTIMENIYVGRYPKKHGLVDFEELKKRTLRLMDELDIHFEPTEYIRNLSVAQRQLVEIMKAISYDSKIIIFDEPTSSLTNEETDILFRIIRELKQKHISMIYISHRLTDIFAIGDRAAVLRDGRNSGEGMVKDLNEDQIIAMMVGRNLENQFPKKSVPIGEVILKAEHITNEKVKDASFELRRGEVLGFGGLVGSGRTELMRAVLGLDKCTGTVTKDGKVINNKSPQDAIKNKFALVPEDRKDQGLVLIRTLLQNIEMSSLKAVSRAGFLNAKKEKECADKYMKQLNVKAPSYNVNAGDLSGGNQQKVVIAKGLATNPDILILDEPTRGIDVGSKAEIYEIMNDLVEKGVSIIMISSELPELMNMSDRIVIMREGRITGVVDAEEMGSVTEEQIMSFATKEI
ncbi:MAG: sugar ABC transporter ATP-binding protein [Lachnospiraceae bacterium]|nr:sugar ABC transporter ATP-binding protein [Lachnospiraceae bacterium]